MNRASSSNSGIALLAGAARCRPRAAPRDGKTNGPTGRAGRRSRCRRVAAVEQPIARFIRATGTLMAEEQADVAAETAGRVVADAGRARHAGVAGRRADSHLVGRNRRAG